MKNYRIVTTTKSKLILLLVYRNEPSRNSRIPFSFPSSTNILTLLFSPQEKKKVNLYGTRNLSYVRYDIIIRIGSNYTNNNRRVPPGLPVTTVAVALPLKTTVDEDDDHDDRQWVHTIIIIHWKCVRGVGRSAPSWLV